MVKDNRILKRMMVFITLLLGVFLMLVSCGGQIPDGPFTTDETTTAAVTTKIMTTKPKTAKKKTTTEVQLPEPFTVTKKIHSSGAMYSFTVSAVSDGTGGFNHVDYYNSKITIVNLANSTQLAKLDSGSINDWVWGGLHIEDINFDGYNDIILNQERVVNQAAMQSFCWLYNPLTGSYDEPFVLPLNAAIDKRDKIVRGHSRGSAAIHDECKYEFINGKLRIIESLCINGFDEYFYIYEILGGGNYNYDEIDEDESYEYKLIEKIPMKKDGKGKLVDENSNYVPEMVEQLNEIRKKYGFREIYNDPDILPLAKPPWS